MSKQNSIDGLRSSFRKSSISSGGNIDSKLKDAEKNFQVIMLNQVDEKSNMSDSLLTTNDTEDFDLDQEEEDEVDDGDPSKSQTLKKIKRFLRRQGKAIVKAFIDYGPPYNDAAWDDKLINECASPILNHWELHSMLNARINPNVPDPDDLYYYPIHWLARNAHVLALKMLRRAGAEVNVTNEMGLSPLHMGVLMKHPPDKRKDQVKVVKYLLDNGAWVNVRDKGGFCAIDHAAANQDAELCQLLIDYGANVLRNNTILVAKRHSILKNVYDPKCYKVLYERLLYEEGQAELRRRQQLVIEKEKQEIKQHERLFTALDKKKAKRLERERLREQAERDKEIEEIRIRERQAELEMNLKEKERTKQRQGEWSRDRSGHWEFGAKLPAKMSSDHLYADNKAKMTGLYEKNRIDPYAARWKIHTGGASLELPWGKADPFKLPGIPTQQSLNPTSSALEQLNKFDTAVGALIDTKSVKFKDENDKELEGEDLEGLIEDLTI